MNNDWIFWGLKIAPIASKGSRDSLMASRAPPPGASEQDKLILKYLREKVDPVFVPMMRTIIQKVKEWDCGNRCVTPVQPGDWGVFFHHSMFKGTRQKSRTTIFRESYTAPFLVRCLPLLFFWRLFLPPPICLPHSARTTWRALSSTTSRRARRRLSLVRGDVCLCSLQCRVHDRFSYRGVCLVATLLIGP